MESEQDRLTSYFKRAKADRVVCILKACEPARIMTQLALMICQHGTTINTEILGKSLDGAYGIWTSSEAVSVHVQSVEIAEPTQFKKDAMPHQAERWTRLQVRECWQSLHPGHRDKNPR